MRFRYTRLLRPYGLALPPGIGSIRLRTPPSIPIEATLVRDVDPLVAELDQYSALANRILRTMFTQSEMSLEDHLREVRNRRRRYGAGPFLVLVEYGDLDWQPSDNVTEVDGLLIDLHGPGRDALRKVVAPAEKTVMCTLHLAANDLGKVVFVDDGGVFLTEEGRPIYAFRPTLGPAAFHVGHPVTAETNAAIERIGHAVVSETQLQRVTALIADALADADDPLRAFLSGWSALEMFINKVFPRYEAAFADDLRRSHPASGHQHYLRRVREVMEKGVRLTDKFAVVAAALTPLTEDADTAAFLKLKHIRDDLAHGTRPIDAPLPYRDPATLAKRLLIAHFGHSADVV